MKYNIAVTGGIGSGKSTIINQLKIQFPNIVYYSIDELVDEMWRNHSWQQQMINEFGHSNRRMISALVFESPDVKQYVYDLSQTYLKDELQKIVEAPFFKIVEFPILFEQNMQHMFDLIVHVTAEADIRIKRATKRDNRTIESVLAIMNNQMSDFDKNSMSDIVVVNDEFFTVETVVKNLAQAIFEHIICKHDKTVVI